jgi:hypothetical protein
MRIDRIDRIGASVHVISYLKHDRSNRGISIPSSSSDCSTASVTEADANSIDRIEAFVHAISYLNTQTNSIFKRVFGHIWADLGKMKDGQKKDGSKSLGPWLWRWLWLHLFSAAPFEKWKGSSAGKEAREIRSAL